MNRGTCNQVEKMKTDLEKMERDVLWADRDVSNATSRILQVALSALEALAEQMNEDLDSLT